MGDPDETPTTMLIVELMDAQRLTLVLVRDVLALPECSPEAYAALLRLKTVDQEARRWHDQLLRRARIHAGAREAPLDGKRCSRCHEVKSLNLFPIILNRPYSLCIACKRTYERERRRVQRGSVRRYMSHRTS